METKELHIPSNTATFKDVDRKKFIQSSAGIIAGSYLLSSAQSEETIKRLTIIPESLKKGDLVAMTGPSGSIWNKDHIAKTEQIMADWGLKTIAGQTLYEQDGYLAGNDKLRAEEFMGFIKNPEVKAILTMRGGWGCGRILDLLDYDIIRENPKIIMGFSDITSLINAVYLRSGIITYHGPCGYSSWGDFTRYHVAKILVSGSPYTLVNPKDHIADLNTYTPGKSKGHLVGGNLTVLTSMIGTPYEPIWKDSILFIEEIGEEPYRIDRMLWQMKHAGVFSAIKGLVMGSFHDCFPEEPEKSFSLEEVLEQHFTDASFPVYGGATFGHMAPKFTLPIGVEVELDATNHSIKLLGQSTLL